MKKRFLRNDFLMFFFFFLNISATFGQNEFEVFRLRYATTGKAAIDNDTYQILNDIKSSLDAFDVSLQYGHDIGEKGFSAIYNVNYGLVNYDLDLPNRIQGIDLQSIPTNYYEQPKFSQISIEAGLIKQISDKWAATTLFALNITDDFFKSSLNTNLTWGSMAYLERQKNENFSFAFGLFLSQLENKLLVFPVASLKIQNEKRGLELLFPQNIRFWQRINQNNYLEAIADFQSYSIDYNENNLVNTTDINVVRAGIRYNYIWQDFIKLFVGLDLPIILYDINKTTETFQYYQKGGLGFNIGISLVFNDE